MTFQSKKEALQAAKQALETIQKIGAPLPVQAQQLVDFFTKIMSANEKAEDVAALPPPPETCEEFVKNYPTRYASAENAILAIKDTPTATKAHVELSKLTNSLNRAIERECFKDNPIDQKTYEDEVTDLWESFQTQAKPYWEVVKEPKIAALFAELKKIETDATQPPTPESVEALTRRLQEAKDIFAAHGEKATVEDQSEIKLALVRIEKTIASKQTNILIPLKTGTKSVLWEPKLTLVSSDINEKSDVLAHKLAIAIKDGKQKKADKLREKIDELFVKTEISVGISLEIKFYQYQQGENSAEIYWGIQSIKPSGGANGYVKIDVKATTPSTTIGESSADVEIIVTRDEVEAKSFDWDALVSLPEAAINDIPTRNVSETTDVITKLLAKNTLKSAFAKCNLTFMLANKEPNKVEFTITEPGKEVFEALSFSTNRVRQNRSFTHNINEVNKTVKAQVEALLNK